ncbi:MAG TPA: hypothetical protein VK177_05880 [Flavobacteriales bacterium]|nr:hypothetical protein [Flavobacteriales bacterium]
MIKGSFTVSGIDVDKMIIGSLRVNARAMCKEENNGTIIIVADEFNSNMWAAAALSHTVIIKPSPDNKAMALVTVLTAGGNESVLSTGSLEQKAQKELFQKIEELLERNNYSWSPLVQEKITKQF